MFQIGTRQHSYLCIPFDLFALFPNAAFSNLLWKFWEILKDLQIVLKYKNPTSNGLLLHLIFPWEISELRSKKSKSIYSYILLLGWTISGFRGELSIKFVF